MTPKAYILHHTGRNPSPTNAQAVGPLPLWTSVVVPILCDPHGQGQDDLLASQ